MIDAIGWAITLTFVPLVIFVGMSMEKRRQWSMMDSRHADEGF